MNADFINQLYFNFALAVRHDFFMTHDPHEHSVFTGPSDTEKQNILCDISTFLKNIDSEKDIPEPSETFVDILKKETSFDLETIKTLIRLYKVYKERYPDETF